MRSNYTANLLPASCLLRHSRFESGAADEESGWCQRTPHPSNSSFTSTVLVTLALTLESGKPTRPSPIEAPRARRRAHLYRLRTQFCAFLSDERCARYARRDDRTLLDGCLPLPGHLRRPELLHSRPRSVLRCALCFKGMVYPESRRWQVRNACMRNDRGVESIGDV